MSFEDKRAMVSSAELIALASRRKTFCVLDNTDLHLQTRELLRLVDDQDNSILCDVTFVSNVGQRPDHVAASVTRIDDLEDSKLMSYGQSSAFSKAQNVKQWQIKGFDSERQHSEWKNLTRLIKEGSHAGASVKAKKVAEQSLAERKNIDLIRKHNLGMEITK